MEALVISVNEPQLDRCLESVKNQTVPFSNIIHIQNVVPNSKAFNLGISKTTEEWAMHIAGDFVLYPNAVEIATSFVNRSGNDHYFGYFFAAHDTFLQCNIGFCGVLRMSAWKTITFEDTMFDDRRIPFRLREKGYRAKKKMYICLTTHFDKPDEFQVFGRFYFHASKFDDSNSWTRCKLTKLLKVTEDPLYQVGIDAMDFAKLKGVHPGSPNVDFARKMFEEFKGLN